MSLANEIFKLKDNSILGNAMEKIINHKNIKLVTSREKYTKYVMKSNFKDWENQNQALPKK